MVISVMLVMTLLVRDEEDMIVTNLEHHLAQGVDQFMVTDNRSVDATPDILAHYVRRGSVRVLQETGDDFDQWRWVTRMAHIAADMGADWILHCDADEFWCAADGLKAALATVPSEYGAAVAPRINFPPTLDETAPFYERLIFRETVSINALGHSLPGKICHRRSGRVQIAQGNHELEADDLRLLPGLLPIEILHFPMRTFKQFERRVIVGGQAYARNHELPPEVGATWRRLYKLYLQGELRDYWNAQVLTTTRLTEGLTTNELCLDTRVRDLARSRLHRPSGEKLNNLLC